MRAFTVRRLEHGRSLATLALAAVLGLHAGAAASAQDEDAPANRFNVIAEEAISDETSLRAVEIIMPPGAPTQAHKHAGSVFVYVLEGDVRSQLNDGPIVDYAPGDTWFEPEGAVHTMVENASATDDAKLLVVFVSPKDAPFAGPAN